MTTATDLDLFARFVDDLAEALDDHASTGDERAARLHFSRYHLDRVVRAVVGSRRRRCGAGCCSSGRRTGWSRRPRR